MAFAEMARMAVLLAALSVASYQDARFRRVGDMVWACASAAGAATYLASPPTPAMLLFLVLGVAAGAAGIALRVFGQADCLALVTASIVMPFHGGIPVALAAAAAAPVLASALALCSNLAYNISDFCHGSLFRGISEAPHRKALAFLVLHRRRKNERFVFRAQRGTRLVFRFTAQDMDFAQGFEGYVASATPLIPFMLAALVLITALLP